MKKALTLFMVFMLILGVLAACGPTREDAQSENDQPETNDGEQAAEEMPEKPESLKIWVNDEEKQKEALQTIFDKYTEETGIEIEVTPISMLDQVEALALDGPAGNGPDIFFQPHDRIGSIVAAGHADPIDLGDTVDTYTQSAIDAVTYDGEIYGVPLVVETYGIFYNKDLVEKAPETLEELNAIAAEHTDASAGTYGFLAEAANFYFSYPFFATYGAYVFNKTDGAYDVEDIGLNNEGAIKGGELIQSWFQNGYIPVEVNPDIISGLFTEGKASVVLSGPWNIPVFQEALGDKLGTAPLPTIDGQNAKSFMGVKSWMLSTYSENKEWATDLMKFITNEENSLHYYEVAGEMPANEAALNSDAVTNNEMVAAFAEQSQYGEPMPSAPEMAQVWEPINNALSFIAKGEPVEDVLNEAVQLIKDNIAAAQ
ncbi:MAG TPA: extracellular solute-binding protein [Bacillus sp. (in: firmicutes)]|uniref:sugar ABC transporter substrate-binding protein n=1 Tax=Bacillus litorisediminis TaxID=2922713 RepID=UPI001FACF66E|nr:extracellular solute-binding protein [Bacillus litorisediminis]HWO75066.1 extracellular solute-binding protein [Bacillus sp. (in: firmicutes)]